eukprot:15468783-Alexandrium_andersonii.AAC.1
MRLLPNVGPVHDRRKPTQQAYVTAMAAAPEASQRSLVQVASAEGVGGLTIRIARANAEG